MEKKTGVTYQIREYLQSLDPKPTVISHEEVASIAAKHGASAEYTGKVVRGAGIRIRKGAS